MPHKLTLRILLNPASGSLLGTSVGQAHTELVRAALAEGANVDPSFDAEVPFPMALESAIRSSADVVVVGGGDGTIAAAANVIRSTNKILGILPLGTMNLLARDLGLPLDPIESIRALASGRVRRIDAGEVNGQLFLNNAVLGFYPALVAEREKLRGRLHVGRWPAFAFGLMRALHRYPLLRIDIDAGKGARRIATPFIAVASSPYDAGVGPVLRRSDLDRGVLGAYVAHHRGTLGMIRLILRMGLGTWAKDDELDQMTATSLTVSSRRRRLRLAIDGEIHRLRPPLVFRVLPGAIPVLVPDARPER